VILSLGSVKQLSLVIHYISPLDGFINPMLLYSKFYLFFAPNNVCILFNFAQFLGYYLNLILIGIQVVKKSYL